MNSKPLGLAARWWCRPKPRRPLRGADNVVEEQFSSRGWSTEATEKAGWRLRQFTASRTSAEATVGASKEASRGGGATNEEAALLLLLRLKKLHGLGSTSRRPSARRVGTMDVHTYKSPAASTTDISGVKTRGAPPSVPASRCASMIAVSAFASFWRAVLMRS